MQVNIHVSRTLANGDTVQFTLTADSVTAAIQAADQLATGNAAGAMQAADTKTADKAPGKTAEKTKAEPTDAGKKPGASAASSPSGAGQETTGNGESAPEATYDDVKKKITAIATKARQLAVDTLARFGVTSGKDLKPEQYASFVEFADMVLDGSVNPAEACADNEALS